MQRGTRRQKNTRMRNFQSNVQMRLFRRMAFITSSAAFCNVSSIGYFLSGLRMSVATKPGRISVNMTGIFSILTNCANAEIYVCCILLVAEYAGAVPKPAVPATDVTTAICALCSAEYASGCFLT